MSKYGLVRDNEVVKMSSKPFIANVSGRPSEDMLKAEGWLPIDDKRPSLLPWQRLGARSEEVLKTKINFTYEVIDTPLEEYKSKKVSELSTNASNEILKRAPQYKQINSALGIYDQDKIDEVKTVISTVRAEHSNKEATILSANDYEAVDGVYTGIVAFMDADEVDENGFPIPKDIDLI